jgi:hypothetical protein
MKKLCLLAGMLLLILNGAQAMSQLSDQNCQDPSIYPSQPKTVCSCILANAQADCTAGPAYCSAYFLSNAFKNMLAASIAHCRGQFGTGTPEDVLCEWGVNYYHNGSPTDCPVIQPGTTNNHA